MARDEAPVSPPVVLTIAGSDSGGGAGIQADLKTIEAGGAFGTSAITSVTAQNTQGVRGSHLLPIEDIEAQIDAVLEDFDVAAVKTGMLATADVIETVVDYADRLPNLVVDPVMVAASGDRLLEPDAEEVYEELIAESTLVTPNADEAAVLTGINPKNEGEAREVGEQLVELGSDAALVKGGHIPIPEVTDVLVTADDVTTIRHPRVETNATHGSGCTLSSAVATRLAHGDDLTAAVESGVDLLSRAIRYNLDVGGGPGAVHHTVEARDRAARERTAETVEGIVAALIDRDVTSVVDSAGLDVVGATPYAEHEHEVAAVEGRVARTLSGLRPNRGVRFGASGRTAELLLNAREERPDLSFACRCRNGSRIETALDELGWETVVLERNGGPGRVEERLGPETVALLDHRTDSTIVLAERAPALRERVVTLAETIE
ncbi:bifunctional hydroxymethylpyrimidine kinase/phosphomethylpyrimidine kinase [Halapricum desulfuricans]|uniref:bifunctional hydroxymethylpyrimidine kinase/phosphomethylpyrimidine kinase n=1 Tax=Halapricum desulfuricans TaxID=2841257 RepID=UPI001E37EE80|nr:bifunctional hydroxymethylpyrimidine kinase/phosphomethylpyrimidine kinase [Halapricum desulfuricans]